jgi:hypothetical protein
MYLNVILTIFVIVQVTIVYLAYRFWKKYGKNMYNSFIDMRKTIPNQMFGSGNPNPNDIMKNLPDMGKMMSEFNKLSKIMNKK